MKWKEFPEALKYFLLAAAALFLFTFWINIIPLWSSDEGRFGEKAREMLELGNWVVPHFNYVAAFEKPVLAYWVTALFYVLFGVAAWSARLTSVVPALVGIGLCYHFTRRFFGRPAAFWAAVVLTTMVGYVLLGRFAMIDMLMTLWLSVSLFCLLTASLEDDALVKRRHYLIAYAAMGLAFLTKGLIGILLPILVFGAFLAWTRNLGEIKRMSLGWGILVIVLIILPWCIAISIQQPEFFKVFIVENHFSRFATQVYGRRRPFWFFAPVLLAVAFPWSFFIPVAIARCRRLAGRQKLVFQFLVSWLAVIFIFFSIPRSKLPYYMLPLSMPVAILVAVLFRESLLHREVYLRDAFVRRTWNTLGAVLTLFLAGLAAYVLLPFPKRPEVQPLVPLLTGGSLLLLAGTLSSWLFYRHNRPLRAVVLLVGVIYLAILMTIAGMKAISPYQSSYDSALRLQAVSRDGDVVAMYASPDRFSDFMFYLKRRVIIVGTDRGSLTEESLEPEDREESKAWFFPVIEFVELFNGRTQRVACLLEADRLPELKENGLGDYTVLLEGHGQLLIANWK